jgi:hypothetical protein
MFAFEWGCLESVTHHGGFLHPMREFVEIVTIGSEMYSKGSHDALCYLDTFDALGA